MRRCRLAAAISACLASGLAHGTVGDPLRAFVTETVTHDDNVFRVPDGNSYRPSADTITATSVQLSLDKQFSRQHLLGTVTRSHNRYQNLSQLDNDASNYNLSWQAAFPAEVTATAGVSRSESLANYADLQFTQAKDLVTGKSSFFRLGYAFHPDWVVSAQATDSKYRNSAAQTAYSDLDTKSREASLQYTTPSGNQVSLVTRAIDARYPHPQFSGTVPINSDYHQYETQLMLQWLPTVKTSAVLRLGRTRREPVSQPQQSFNGTTSNLTVNWAATVATSFNAFASRDLTPETSNLVTYAVMRSYGVGANWAPTAKITATARFDRTSRQYAGNVAAIGSSVASPNDVTRGSSLGLQYAPTSYLQLALQFRHESRESHNANLPYTANVMNLTATLSF